MNKGLELMSQLSSSNNEVWLNFNINNIVDQTDTCSICLNLNSGTPPLFVYSSSCTMSSEAKYIFISLRSITYCVICDPLNLSSIESCMLGSLPSTFCCWLRNTTSLDLPLSSGLPPHIIISCSSYWTEVQNQLIGVKFLMRRSSHFWSTGFLFRSSRSMPCLPKA